MCQAAWRSRRVPNDWPTAVIITIHKKGYRIECTNYRGISLLRNILQVQVPEKKMPLSIEPKLEDTQCDLAVALQTKVSLSSKFSRNLVSMTKMFNGVLLTSTKHTPGFLVNPVLCSMLLAINSFFPLKRLFSCWESEITTGHSWCWTLTMVRAVYPLLKESVWLGWTVTAESTGCHRWKLHDQLFAFYSRFGTVCILRTGSWTYI